MNFDQKTLEFLYVNCANPLTQRIAATTSPVLLNFHKMSVTTEDAKNKDLRSVIISPQKAAFPLISHENTHAHLGFQQLSHLQLPSFSLPPLIAMNGGMNSSCLFEWVVHVALDPDTFAPWRAHHQKSGT